MFKAIAGSAVVIGAFNAIRNSIGGAISRFDTLNNFPRVMELMGFSAEESEKAIKKLADGIDGLPTALDEVTGTAQRLATMTGDLDGAIETTLALNNAFLASGASTADASRGLEQFVQMLATGTVDLQSWRTLQETMPIALNKTAEAFGFAGESAQNDLYEALKSGEITFDEFNNKLIELSNETGGFADMAREGSTGIATSWQNIRTAIVKGVADVIGVIDESLASFGGISGVMDTVKSGIQAFFNFVVTNLPIAIDWFKSVVDAVREWLPAFEEGKGYLQEVFTTMRDIAVPIFQEVVNFIMTVWGNLVSWWQQHGEMITQGARNFMDGIWNVMQTIWPVIQFLIVDTWNAIKGVIEGAISVITGIIQAFGALFTGDWSALWDAIKQIVSGAIQFVWNFIQLWFVGKILKAGKSLFNGLKAIVTTLWQTIKSLFTNGVNTARNVVNAGFNFIRSIISGVMNAIKSIISGAWNVIRGTTTTVIGAIRNTIRNIFNSFRGIVSNAFNGVRNAVRNGIDGALNIIKNMFGKFKQAGRNIITSIAEGIKGAIGAVTDAIGGVVNKVRNFLPFSPAKEGPLKDIHRLDFAGPISTSVRRATPKIQAMLQNMLALPQIDIAGQINSLHAQSQQRMAYDYQNELTVNKQPAYINLVLGGQEFSAFVDDITTVQDRKTRVKRAFV